MDIQRLTERAALGTDRRNVYHSRQGGATNAGPYINMQCRWAGP